MQHSNLKLEPQTQTHIRAIEELQGFRFVIQTADLSSRFLNIEYRKTRLSLILF